MSYLDELSEKDLQKSMLASLRRAEGKKAAVSFQLEADDVLTEQLMAILAAIEGLKAAVMAMPAPVVNVPPQAEIPAPVVHIDPPDLADIVNAVTSLNGTGPSAEEIASAIAATLNQGPVTDNSGAEALNQVAAALEKLDFRLKGMGTQAYGGGAVTFAPGAAQQFADAMATGPAPAGYDYIDNTYTGENLTQVVYKQGGAAGTVVATLTMTYDGSKLDTATWST